MQASFQEAIEHHKAGRLDAALEGYRSVLIESGPQGHLLYLMGVVLNGLDQKEDAFAAFESAWALNPKHVPTACCLGRARQESGDSAGAQAVFEAAVLLAPNHIEALEGLALAHEHQAHLDEAIHSLQKLYAAGHHPASTLCRIAKLYERQGNITQARNSAEGARALAPEDAAIVLTCANLAFEDKDYTEAEARYRTLLNLTPESAVPHFQLACLFFIQHKFDWALKAFESAYKLDPTLSECLRRQGECAVHLLQYNKAKDYFESFRDQGGEQNGDFNYFYGEALRATGATREAIIHLQKSLVSIPDRPEAYISLGHALRTQERFDVSVASFEKALRLRPHYYDAHLGLSTTLREIRGDTRTKQLERALKHALICLDYRPNNPGALFNLANIYMDFGLPHASIVAYKRALSNDGPNVSSESSCCFNANYLGDISAEALFEQHEQWGKRHVSTREKLPPPTNSPEPERRLKLGIFSPDFCIHPVAYFLHPCLAHFDREGFELFFYYNNFDNKQGHDDFTEKFRNLAHHFIEIQKLSHAELAQKIRDDGIDILIELAGHSCGQRHIALAQRPAPIQCTWLGYPNTTGSDAIDYRIGDPITDPPEHDHLSTEKLLRLPTGFNIYQMPYCFPDVDEAPCAQSNQITFGSFNNTCKHNPYVLKLWGRVLAAVPNSRLILKDKFLPHPRTRDYILENVCASGVAPEQIAFLEFTNTNFDHMRCYGQMDIALDPHPYNGTTTSCEALLMGVPILTRFGDRHAARVTASILHRVGLDDWIARDEEDFVRLAVEKASDRTALIALRKRLRAQVMASPLYDGQRFARELAEALRQVWRQWCRDQRTQACQGGENSPSCA